MAPTRGGFGSLFAALGLLALLAFVAFFHFGLSRRALSSVQQNHLAALARIQGRSAVEELLSQVSLDANEPATPLFELLRQNLDRPWTQLDLKPLLRPPEILIRPSWGRRSEDERESPITGSLVDWLAVLRSPRRSVDPRGTEEWVAVLTLTAMAEMQSPQGAVRRLVSASYEVRCLLTGPPRPFDQVPLYLGSLEPVVDPRRANGQRRQVLREHEELRQELLDLASRDAAGVGARLGQLAEAMLEPDPLAARTLALPETGGVLIGPYHVDGPFPLASQDLVARLEEQAPEREAQRERLRQALAAGDGPALKQAALDRIGGLNLALDAIWRFQWHNTLLTPEHPRFAEELALPLQRLRPEYFLDRVHLRAPPEHPLITRWLAGHARVNGVLDMRGPGAVRLAGQPRGRVSLLVGGGGAVRLEDLRAGDGGDLDDRLTLVSLGADVEVLGEVEASVLMLPAPGQGPESVGHFHLALGATLLGNLVAPHARADSVSLEGSMAFDPRLRNPFPPSATLMAPGLGHYVFVVSPAPIFLAGANS